MEIYFRHEKVRMHQQELLNDSYATVSESRHLLAHAPVGLGKTDAVLGAAITHAMQENLTVFFLTPKISQHRIAIDVVRGIEQKYKLGLRAVDMIGRRYACIDDTLAELDHEGFYFSCQKKRREESCEYYGNAKGYKPVQEAQAQQRFQKMLANYGSAKTHNEIVGIGEQQASCPYEWMIKLAGVANVIVADYYHVMVPNIREIFLRKIKKQLDKSIIIIDEGHNLPKRIREHLSSSANSYICKKAEKEIELTGNEKLPLEKAFNSWNEELLKNQEEMLVTQNNFSDWAKEFNLTNEDLAGYLEQIGSSFIERTNRKSACLRLAKFLAGWNDDAAGIVRILRKKSWGFSLSKRFLDPSPATRMLNDCHASITMSGTLLPLEMHRDVLGLDGQRAVLKHYASPFDEKNQMNIIAENGTTRYSQRTFENYKGLAKTIDNVISASPKGVAVFFPSYVVLNAILPLLATKQLLVQKEKMSSKEIADIIRMFGNGGTLCAVQGGSLAEGIDYSNQEIKTAIIVGIALDEMGLEIKALIDYYQDKFGKGWEYGYLYPGMIKALQAAGRGIRKESDRAAVVFLDERFKWKNYRTLLGNKQFIVTNEPEKYVEKFWGKNKDDENAADTKILA